MRCTNPTSICGPSGCLAGLAPAAPGLLGGVQMDPSHLATDTVAITVLASLVALLLVALFRLPQNHESAKRRHNDPPKNGHLLGE